MADRRNRRAAAGRIAKGGIPVTRAIVPYVERCEDRALTTLVFVHKGASFAATGPSRLTSDAAAVLQRAGNRVVQLWTPPIR